MNQLFKKGIAWLLLLSMLALCAVGCAKDPAPGEETGNSETESTTTTEPTPEATEPVTPPVETEGAAISYTLKSMQIIRPADDVTAMSAATTLYNLLKANKHRVERPTEDVNVTTPGIEYLVGNTNRAISAKVAARLTADNQYIISFQKEGIVIHAKTSLVLSDAVTYFMETYVPQATGGVLTVNENHTYIGTTNLVEIADAEKLHYKVVYSYTDDAQTKDGLISSKANDIATRLKNLTGIDVSAVDDMETFGADDKLILLGNVSAEKFPELYELRKDWAFPEYGMIYAGNRIYVTGSLPEMIVEAGNLFISRLSNQSVVIDGKLILSLPDQYSEADDVYLTEYPQFTAVAMTECFKNPDDELVYSYSKVTTEQYEAYVQKLVAAGFVVSGGEHTIGRNRFSTCVKADEGQVHVAFYPAANGIGNMQIFAGKFNSTVAIPQETYDPATQKVTETTFHVMSLDYSTGYYATGKRLCDGSGMSYLVTLEDGRYVVFDGGYTDLDGENLYQYMLAENKRPDGKIVIAAWFISHDHDDHTGGFNSFALNHADDVEVQYMVVNALSNERYGSSHWMTNNLAARTASLGAELIKPHTGQVLTFCNTEFEIIISHESLNASAFIDSNNTSTVVRMWEKGTSIMITGDASVASCNKMVSLYGDALKSDIFQLNHHAVSGGTLNFYQKVAPSYALWTTSEDSFSGHDDPNANCGYDNCVGRTGRINGGGNSAGSGEQSTCNKWIRDTVGIENCYVADDVIEQITFTEDGPVFNTETGYFVNNQVGTVENEGVLQMPASSEE